MRTKVLAFQFVAVCLLVGASGCTAIRYQDREKNIDFSYINVCQEKTLLKNKEGWFFTTNSDPAVDLAREVSALAEIVAKGGIP